VLTRADSHDDFFGLIDDVDMFVPRRDEGDEGDEEEFVHQLFSFI
jgi:hypothetical protein